MTYKVQRGTVQDERVVVEQQGRAVTVRVNGWPVFAADFPEQRQANVVFELFRHGIQWQPERGMGYVKNGVIYGNNP